MALSKSRIQAPLASILAVETAASSTETLLNAASTVIYVVDVDNTANSGPVFLKLYNNDNPDVGTTNPEMVFKVAAASRQSMLIPEGHTYSTDLAIACVTTGGTAGTSSPASAVVVRILFT